MDFITEITKKDLNGMRDEEVYATLSSQELHYHYYFSNNMTPESYISLKAALLHTTSLMSSLMLGAMYGDEVLFNTVIGALNLRIKEHIIESKKILEKNIATKKENMQ